MDRRMAQGAFGRQLTVPDHVRFDGTIAEERTSPDVRLELMPDIEHKKGRRPARKDCPASHSVPVCWRKRHKPNQTAKSRYFSAQQTRAGIPT
jgi:hypothetical protein